MSVRKELRNYVTHGAFGKQGQAFEFHSGAGAVPVLLPHRRGSNKFSLGEGLKFNLDSALRVIEDLSSYIWMGVRMPAKIYIQQSGLPAILTMAGNNTYLAAMQSVESMNEFVEDLSNRFCRARSMDW